jgi:hypothetical protein
VQKNHQPLNPKNALAAKQTPAARAAAHHTATLQERTDDHARVRIGDAHPVVEEGPNLSALRLRHGARFILVEK